MQTFLPYPDFTDTASVLDRQRLGKQRVEAYQVLRNLLGISSRGWSNHPAVKMWDGYEFHLARYGAAICREWVNRGYKDTLWPKFNEMGADCVGSSLPLTPPWLGDPDLHASHRANLLRKDPIWYGQFGWTEDPSLPYVWPTPIATPAQARSVLDSVSR